jgi:hypothetical protein
VGLGRAESSILSLPNQERPHKPIPGRVHPGPHLPTPHIPPYSTPPCTLTASWDIDIERSSNPSGTGQNNPGEQCTEVWPFEAFSSSVQVPVQPSSCCSIFCRVFYFEPSDIMSLSYAITRVAAKTLNNPACFTRSLRRMGSVSAIDSGIFRSLFGTDEIRQVCNG